MSFAENVFTQKKASPIPINGNRDEAATHRFKEHIGFDLEKPCPDHVIPTGVMRSIAKWRNLVSNGEDNALAGQIP